MPYVDSVLSLFETGVIEFRNILELLGLKAHMKPLVRLVVKEDEREALSGFCASHSLILVASDFKLKPVFTTPLGDTFLEKTSFTDPLATNDVLFIAQSKEVATQAIFLERNSCDAEETGRLYGYPPCCASNYPRIQDGEHWLVSYFGATEDIVHSWLNNKIAYLFPPHLAIFPDYFPCSIDCEATRSLALRYAALLDLAGCSELLDLVREQLTKPVLICNHWIYLFSERSGTYPHLNIGGNALCQDLSGEEDRRDALQGISRVEICDDGSVHVTHSQGVTVLNRSRGDRFLLFE